MRKVAQPVCDCCGKRYPEFESEFWSLRLCYQCVRMAATYLHRNDLLIPNTLSEELFLGVWRNDDSKYEVVVESTLASNASSFLWIDRVQSDRKESS